MLPWHSLLTIHKSFARPHLDYGNIQLKVYVKKLRLYNAALAITVAIKGTPQIKFYNELGLEPLEFSSWWFRKLCLFYKIKKNWYVRISVQYDITRQPSVKHLVN